jgi:O-antigen/teichoic acid export membrane protein
MTKRASYRESIAFGGLSTAGMMVLGLVSSVAIARIYGVRTLGEFALAQAPSVAMSYLASVREQSALVRHLAVLEPRAPPRHRALRRRLRVLVRLTAVVASLSRGRHRGDLQRRDRPAGPHLARRRASSPPRRRC